MNDCLFCKIAAGEIPADILHDDEDVLAFKDINPQAPHHFLVIPKRHISGPSDMIESDDILIGKLLRVAAQVAAANGCGDNFRVVINNGAEAGQEVFHMHLHILGGRKMNWPPG